MVSTASASLPRRRPQVRQPCAHGDPQAAGGSVLFPGQCATCDMRRPGLREGGGVYSEAVTMGRPGGIATAGGGQQRRRADVEVILLLLRNGRILMRERSSTGSA